jgi:hypothetical protein
MVTVRAVSLSRPGSDAALLAAAFNRAVEGVPHCHPVPPDLSARGYGWFCRSAMTLSDMNDSAAASAYQQC